MSRISLKMSSSLKVLAALEQRITNETLAPELQRLAKPVLGKIEVNAPVKSGELKRDLSARLIVKPEKYAVVRIGMNYKDTTPTIYNRAHYKERGNKRQRARPFIAPVAESLNHEQLTRQMQRFIEQQIKTAQG